MLPANLLALYLNKPYTDLESFVNGHIYNTGERGRLMDMNLIKKVLVVDDSVFAGEAMERAKQKLAKSTVNSELVFCAVYVSPGSERHLDIWFEEVAPPRVFQWNVLHHSVLERACVDIDGVLCVDPTEEQNDDGIGYVEFLRKATPLFLPSRRIRTIVTSRLEKYRDETEFWLREHGITYDSLVMLDLPSKEARQASGCHATHKAREYLKKEYSLFIESDPMQSLKINEITKKPVLCTATFEMVYHNKKLIDPIRRRKLGRFKRWCLSKLNPRFVKAVRSARSG